MGRLCQSRQFTELSRSLVLLGRRCVDATSFEMTSSDCFKLTRVALERNALRQAEFSVHIGQYNPEQLVFCEESAIDCRTTYRSYGWSLMGQPATRHAFFLLWSKVVTLLSHFQFFIVN